MKNLKKILALVVAALLIVASMSVALASTLTITPNNKLVGHSYEAYQIFKGNLNADQTKPITDTAHPVQLNTIAWGDNVNGTALIDAIKANDKFKTDDTYDFADVEDAADVAAVLATYANNSAKLRAFADVLSSASGVLVEKPSGDKKDAVTASAGAGVDVVFNNLDDGYYFIKDTEESQDIENGSYTKFMLDVVGNTTATAKDTLPTIDKVIVEGSNEVKTSNGSIGDKVSYKVTGKVPNMDGYESYLYEISDTMTEGLTFNDDLSVKIGQATLQEVVEHDNKFYPVGTTEYNDDNAVIAGYVVTKDFEDEDDTTFKIHIVNFIQYAANTDIEVTYSATINEKAKVYGETTTNDNTAKLTYSNNPNNSGKGDNGEPDSTNPAGEGPDKTVKTYTTAIELEKVDGQNKDKKLEGAVFTIEGDAQNVTITTKGMYVKATAEEIADSSVETFFMLKDGTYTKTAPNSEVEGKTVSPDAYADTENQYKKITVVTKDYNGSATTKAISTTDTTGLLTFKGLGEGLYTVTETQSPTGYNLLTSRIYIYVDFKVDANDATTGEYKVYKFKGTEKPTIDNNTDFTDTSKWEVLSKNNTNYHFDFQVENNSGTTLPSTGGIGTTIFYVAGSILVLAAAILLITKRRMSAND